MLEGKLTRVSFPSPCNVVALVLEGKVTCVRLPSWWNVFDGNVVVPVGKITRVRFHSHAMLFIETPFWLFQKER